MRLMGFIFLIVAAILTWNKVNNLPNWTTFQKTGNHKLSETNFQKHLSIISSSKFGGEISWLPQTERPSVHAASSIPTKNGGWRSFWFAGSREGAADVVILSSEWNTAEKKWGKPIVVLDRESAQQSLGRYIAKLGNPVPVRNKEGHLQLYIVSVSIGGWAGSSINLMESYDEGSNWTPPKRLVTSPMINISTLVKSPSFFYTDGTIGIPVYHEFIGKFGELIRVDSSGKVIDKRRLSSGRGTLQPVIFIDNENNAQAYFRQARKRGPHHIAVSQTNDSGWTWKNTEDLNIPNPNSAIAGIELLDRTRLLVFNDLEHGRYRLVMAASWPEKTNDSQENEVVNKVNYSQWQVIKTIEDDSSNSSSPKGEFSYPYMEMNASGDILLAYTWNRKKIKTILFEKQLLMSQLESEKFKNSSKNSVDSKIKKVE